MDSMPNRIPAVYQPGDLVYLASGSPRLTVISWHGNLTLCGWYDWPTMHYHTTCLPTNALKPAKPAFAAWNTPPYEKQPEQIVRSSRTNQLLSEHPPGAGCSGRPPEEDPYDVPFSVRIGLSDGDKPDLPTDRVPPQDGPF